MNKNDSELIELSMTGAGFVKADDVDSADILIVNTCSVRATAENRAIVRMRSSKPLKKRGGIVVAAGCMAQRIGPELIKKKIAHMVVGPYQVPETGQLVRRYLKFSGDREFLSQDIYDFSQRLNPRLTKKSSHDWHRWITISHGCENFCSYCIVPHVRGKLVSFKSSEILEHIKQMADLGVIEITLLGQNVNQYGLDSNDIPFYSLMAKAAEIDGLKKINFLTSHPMDFNEDIISVIIDHKNIARSVHLPLQSGSDRILRLMNRKYTMESYNKIVDMVRKIPGGSSISTDIIVGFPGETAEDFMETMDAVKKIGFDDAFTYVYSERSGTPASKIAETITKEEKHSRLGELIVVQRAISKEKLRARIGMTELVIAETVSKKNSSELAGKTFFNHPVVFPGDKSDIGIMKEIKIEGVKGHALHGREIQ